MTRARDGRSAIYVIAESKMPAPHALENKLFARRRIKIHSTAHRRQSRRDIRAQTLDVSQREFTHT